MSRKINGIVKKAFAGICAVAIGIGLAACGTANAATGGTKQDDVLERIQKSGEINIGVSGAWPPYQLVDKNGELQGIEISITKSIAKSLGVKPVYHKAKWDSLIGGLESDRYDLVVHNLVVTPERAAKFDYSIPYANDPSKVAVLDSVPGNSIDDLKGKKIAVGITSNFATDVQKKGATVVDTSTDQAEFVKAGRADGVAGTLTVIQTIIQKNPDLKLKILEGSLSQNESVAFFKKNQPELKKKVNAAIEQGLKDGEYKQYFEEFTGADLTPSVTK